MWKPATSKIATIVYKQYTENVDMKNEFFDQNELQLLWENDKDIIRVEFYEDGILVMSWTRSFVKTKNTITKLNKMVAATQKAYELKEDFYDNEELQEQYSYKQLCTAYDKAYEAEQKEWKVLLSRMVENKEINLDVYFEGALIDSVCREMCQSTEEEALYILIQNGGY